MNERGWLAALTGDAEVAGRLTEPRQLADMLRVEAVFSRALGQVGQVNAATAQAAAKAIEGFSVDVRTLAEEAAVDGMPVPGLVRQLRAHLPEALHGALHTGLTSQDVMDTALILALRDVLDLFEARMAALDATLKSLRAQFGDAPLMARTRMQAALPIETGHRIDGWMRPLAAHRAALGALRARLLRLQLGGPVGTRGSFQDRGEAIADAMAAELGLIPAAGAWHTERAPLAELAGWLSMVSGALGKMGHDLCLMAQQGVDAATMAGAGTSSAMSHKANPVRAEILVTLARYNAVLLPGMHLALDHEQERSGIAWTLEWLVLPRMLEVTGAGLRQATGLLGNVVSLGDTG